MLSRGPEAGRELYIPLAHSPGEGSSGIEVAATSFAGDSDRPRRKATQGEDDAVPGEERVGYADTEEEWREHCLKFPAVGGVYRAVKTTSLLDSSQESSKLGSPANKSRTEELNIGSLAAEGVKLGTEPASLDDIDLDIEDSLWREFAGAMLPHHCSADYFYDFLKPHALSMPEGPCLGKARLSSGVHATSARDDYHSNSSEEEHFSTSSQAQRRKRLRIQ